MGLVLSPLLPLNYYKPPAMNACALPSIGPAMVALEALKVRLKMILVKDAGSVSNVKKMKV
jgi:hypothetical protein